MRKNLFSGLIILLPVAITFWFFRFFIDILTDPFVLQVQNTLLFISDNHYSLSGHPHILLAISRTIILIFLFGLVVLLGYLGKKIIFNWIEK